MPQQCRVKEPLFDQSPRSQQEVETNPCEEGTPKTHYSSGTNMSFSNIKHSREAINQNLQDMFSSFRDDSHIPDGFR